MPQRLKLLFVLTDGGRARLVERSPANGHYITLEEMDRMPPLATAWRAPARAGASPPRRPTSGLGGDLRAAKQAFVARVAERAADICRRNGFDGVVVAAPSPLIGDLRTRLNDKAEVAGAIRKDLTGVPNSRLGAWLNDVYANPQLAQ